MHTFSVIDAQILLGLAGADKGADISCQELVASCAAVNNSIPALAEFAEAFNKFLYISVIHIEGEQIALAGFGWGIINKARSHANSDAQSDELMKLVLKELSGYKLKSMCNRHVWTQTQYQQAVDLQRNNIKPRICE